MDWITGLLQGFSARKGEIEQQNLEEALRSRQRESAVLETLINSPDQETRSLAIAGLLESARPGKRKSGLSGWLGQMEQSPYLQQIRGLSPTVRQQVSVPDVPTQQGYIPDAPPATGGAAQPTTNPTVQGPDGAPLSPVQPIVSDSTSVVGQAPPDSPIMPDARAVAREQAGTPPPRTMLDVERQRQVFATPADLERERARAVAMGRVEGGVAGFEAAGGDPEAYRAGLLQEMQRGLRGGSASAAGQTYAEGEITPDPESPTGYSQTLYLRADPRQIRKIPANAPTARSTRPPSEIEIVAHSLFGQPDEDPRGIFAKLTPEQAAVARQRVQQDRIDLAAGTTTARAGAAAAAPLTTQQRVQLTTTLGEQWQQYTKDWSEMTAATGKLQSAMQAAERGDVAAATEAFTVVFQKVLDPNSVVRESEAERPGAFQGLLTRAEQGLRRLVEGGGAIPISELRTYLRVAQEMTTTVGQLTAGRRALLTQRAVNNGLDPNEIFSRTDPGRSGLTGLGVGAPPPTSGAGTPPPGPGRTAAPAGGSPLDQPAVGANGPRAVITTGANGKPTVVYK